MKRKIAGLLTALMVLSMGMTAFAASPDTDNTSKEPNAPATSMSEGVKTAKAVVTDKDGNVIEIDASKVKVYSVTNAEAAAAQEKAVKEVGAKAKVLKVFEIPRPAGMPEGATIELTLEVPGVVAGANISVMHNIGNSGKWEVIKPTKVENGKVTFKTDSFSQFAIVANEASPGTGESVPVLPIVMVVCAAGVVFCVARIRFNR